MTRITTATHRNRLHRQVAYADPIVKKEFHSTGRLLLKRLAEELESTYGEWEVRSNKGGIAVSGEVTLHMDRLYVQVAQSCMGNDKGILFRSCNGRKDYTGGHNNFAPLAMLPETADLAATIKQTVSQAWA